MSRNWLRALRLTAVLAIAIATSTPPSFAAEVSLAGDLVTFTEAPMESQAVAFELRPRGLSPTHLIVSATGTTGLVAGPGCGTLAEPSVPNRVVACSVFGPRLSLRAHLGDANDLLEADSQLRASVSAGNGDDTVIAHGDLAGEEGNDVLRTLYEFDHRAQTLRGGPGDDTLSGIAGRDVLIPGPGNDVVFASSDRFRDGARDVVRARDGESDDVYCDFTDQGDSLLIDGLDLPLSRSRRCSGIRRSSRPRAIPVEIESPPFFPEDCCSGTRITVACPLDMNSTCRGTVTARTRGHRIGSSRFIVPPGRKGAVRISDGEFSDPDCERSVPASAMARTKLGNGVLVATRRLDIEPCESNHG